MITLSPVRIRHLPRGQRVAPPPPLAATPAARRRCASAVAAGALLLLAGCATLAPRDDVAWINYVPPPPIQAGAPRNQRNLEVFDWVWRTVDTLYYDPAFRGVDWNALRTRYRAPAEAAPDDGRLYGVINAMLGELQDGHTRALSPQAAEERRARRWVWIGLEYAPLKEEPEKVVVTYVWPGGAALDAGVRRGWILESCDGQGAKTFLSSFLGEHRLADGQKVHCVFRDERDQPRAIELAARSVSRPRIQEALWFANRSLYLRFDEFKPANTEWLTGQLRAHHGAPALILDLRYNTGGDLADLESIAGLFIPRGRPLGTFFKRGATARPLQSRRAWLMPAYQGRLAIITSHDSASAAEIFVSAVKNNRPCVVVGQRTAGEVLNAFEVDLPDGGKLSVSIRDFRTPDGRRLEGAGVEPDAAVNYHLDQLRAGRDPGVDAALQALPGMLPERGV